MKIYVKLFKATFRNAPPSINMGVVRSPLIKWGERGFGTARE